jgi:hypothetical protein
MDGQAMLRNRIGAVNAAIHTRAADLRGLDLARPVAAGTSPPGLTLWHLPRVVDWLVQTSIRDVPEVADTFPPDGLPDHRRFGFGTGLTPDEAQEAAGAVRLEAVNAYSDAVTAEVDSWLATLAPEDLDTVPPFLERQHSRPAYSTPGALAEIQGLIGLPVGTLVLRPAISHVFMHAGELDVLTQIARA